MLVALYSKVARQHVNAARDFVAAQGFPPTPDGIRRARDELLGTPAPVQGIASHGDFFSISECRDLLFHVQEQQFTIPEIASFLEEHKLRFIGFEMHPSIAAKYRGRFPDDPAMTSLASWELFEKRSRDVCRHVSVLGPEKLNGRHRIDGTVYAVAFHWLNS